jgi:hypothetical protein
MRVEPVPVTGRLDVHRHIRHRRTMSRTIAWLLVLAAASAVPAFGWPGRPGTPAPRPAEPGGPPPAWAETQAKAVWLLYGSYCWRTACADYLPPTQRGAVPTLSAAYRATIRLHLGFAPSKLQLRFVPSNKVVRLAPRRIAAWQASVGGIVSVETRAATGSASYVLRIRLRS